MNKLALLVFTSLLLAQVSANFLGLSLLSSNQSEKDPYDVPTQHLKGHWDDGYYTDSGEYVDKGYFTAEYRNYTEVNELWVQVQFHREFYNGTRNLSSEDPFVSFYDEGGYTYLDYTNITQEELLPIIVKRLRQRIH